MPSPFYGRNLAEHWRERNLGLNSGAFEARLREKTMQTRIEGFIASEDYDAAEKLLQGGAPQPEARGRVPEPGILSERNLSVFNFGNVRNLQGGFNVYASPTDGQMGILERLLRYHDDPKRGARSIRYAPPGENDTGTYAAFLTGQLGVSPDAEIDIRNPDVQSVLLNSITRYEHGAFVVQDPAIVDESIARTAAGEKPRIVGSAPQRGQTPAGRMGQPGRVGSGQACGLCRKNPGRTRTHGGTGTAGKNRRQACRQQGPGRGAKACRLENSGILGFGASSTAFGALASGRAAEVEQAEEADLNQELARYCLPATPRNRMVLKTRALLDGLHYFRKGELDFER